MPKPSLRSRKKIRRVQVRTPAGRTVVHYERKKPGKAHCSICGGVLKGVPCVKKHELRNMAKTKKRPERAYGGILCSACARRKIISDYRKLIV